MSAKNKVVPGIVVKLFILVVKFSRRLGSPWSFCSSFFTCHICIQKEMHDECVRKRMSIRIMQIRCVKHACDHRYKQTRHVPSSGKSNPSCRATPCAPIARGRSSLTLLRSFFFALPVRSLSSSSSLLTFLRASSASKFACSLSSSLSSSIKCLRRSDRSRMPLLFALLLASAS